MAFNPNLPANLSVIDAAELRNQFNGLKALIDAQAAQLTTQAALIATQGSQLTTQGTQVAAQAALITAQGTLITGIFPIGCTVGYFKNLTSVPALPGTWV